MGSEPRAAMGDCIFKIVYSFPNGIAAGAYQIGNRIRQRREVNVMSGNFLQDIRYALRDPMKNRGFTAVAVLTLAAGIGANSAMFSVVRGVLMDPLPYPKSGELYRVFYSSHEYPKFPFNPGRFCRLPRAQPRLRKHRG